MSDAPQTPAPPGPKTAWFAVGVALLVTLLVTVLSYALPAAEQASGVGLAFLLATYLLVLRRDNETVRRYGLALGGLFESEPLSLRRLAGATARAFAWALAVALVVFPAFWFGWVAWWKPEGGFVPAPPSGVWEASLGQLLVIALPEEAFYRGYLQSALDDAWPKRVRFLGAELGPSLIVTSALFALGHLATDFDANRLAVFFPALLFGWLRARTGGIGASVLLHAFANLFSAYLAQSYGFG